MATVILNLIYGKLVAVYIKPEAFGLYSIQFAVFSVINAVFMIPLVNGFKTFFSRHQNIKLISFFERIILLCSFVSSIFFLIVNCLGLFHFTHLDIIIISSSLFLQTIYSVRLAYINLKSNHLDFGKFNIFQAIIALLSAVLIFIFFKKTDSSSLWIILAISMILPISLILFYQKRQKEFIDSSVDGLILESNLLKKLFKYCFPLIVLAFIGSLNNYADKYIISLFMKIEDVGYYSAGYGFGSKISLLVTPILTYLTPVIFKFENQNSNQTNSKINQFLIYHGAIGLAICTIVYFSKYTIGTLFLDNQYIIAFDVIPLVAFGFLFFNSVFIIEIKFYASSKTHFILIHHIFGAFFNISLNLLLIPIYGILGAAYACIIGFFVQFCTAYYLMYK